MKSTIGLLLYLAFLTNIHAYNFKHFELKGELKEVQNTTSKALRSFESKSALTKQINAKLLGDLTPSDPDSRYNDLFGRILEAIGSDYNMIGNQETGPLLLNHQIGGGVVNFSGFTWQRPFVNFKLFANRELAPDLYEDRWIVHDSLTIVINASTLLSNMRDLNLIDIDDAGLSAFAGVGFSRTYHYYHFAPTWEEGLVADYSKLFLTFTRFNTKSVLDLEPYHLLKRQDSFMFNAGGFVNVPVWNGLGIRGGVLVSKSFENTLTVQSLGEGDNPRKDEFLRVSIESESQTSADAHLSLQVDFFNLLKLTLLSYDLEYSVENSEKVYLSFFEQDKSAITGASKEQFGKLVTGKTSSVDYFKSNIVQQDQRYKENLNSKFYFLIFGAINKSATEQIKIVKDGIEKIFYKHYAESRKIIQNIWSKIWGIIVQKIFRVSSGSTNSSELSKKMEIEYEYEGKLENTQVLSAEKFSVKLVQSFYAQDTDGLWKRYYRKQAVSHLSRYTAFDMEIAKFVGDSKIVGPMQIITNVIIEQSGLRFFNKLDEESARKNFSLVCEGGKVCFNELNEKYNDYKNKLKSTGVIDLMKFKSFLGRYYKSIRSNFDFYLLFGTDNVFINGSINAATDTGLPFQNFFKAGQFKGLGVIDDFMRSGSTQIILPIETN